MRYHGPSARRSKHYQNAVLKGELIKMKLHALSALSLVTASILSAADAPYIGKWKLDAAKSQFAGQTLLIDKTPDGGYHVHQNDVDFNFKLDGKEYATPDGGTFATKAVDANTWDLVDRMKSKVRGTQHLSVSGDTLTGTGQQIKADGGTIQFSTTWKRVSGGPGFLGQWKSTENSTSGTIELEANGPDGVTLKFPDDGSHCDAKFDGKDCPLTGPTAGDKTALSLKKIGSRSLEVTQKLNGKAVYVDTYTVSADGKTLTDEGTPVSRKEMTKAVYDRQ
jgi:hypothetical protein